MTEADWRALEQLCSYPEALLVRPGGFGDALWGGKRRSGNCSCPYARQAGKVLNRLRDRDYATWEHEESSWGWRATKLGRLSLKRAMGVKHAVGGTLGIPG